jgi:hypothetical protein
MHNFGEFSMQKHLSPGGDASAREILDLAGNLAIGQ